MLRGLLALPRQVLGGAHASAGGGIAHDTHLSAATDGWRQARTAGAPPPHRRGAPAIAVPPRAARAGAGAGIPVMLSSSARLPPRRPRAPRARTPTRSRTAPGGPARASLHGRRRNRRARDADPRQLPAAAGRCSTARQVLRALQLVSNVPRCAAAEALLDELLGFSAEEHAWERELVAAEPLEHGEDVQHPESACQELERAAPAALHRSRCTSVARSMSPGCGGASPARAGRAPPIRPRKGRCRARSRAGDRGASALLTLCSALSRARSSRAPGGTTPSATAHARASRAGT